MVLIKKGKAVIYENWFLKIHTLLFCKNKFLEESSGRKSKY